MAWLELSLELQELDAEAVQACCESLGAISVTLTDAGDEPVLEPLPGQTPTWTRTRLSALFADMPARSADTDESTNLRRRLARRIGIDPQRIYMSKLTERDWSNEWRAAFAPMCFGERLWICQDGETPDGDGSLVVNLDPGLAFGTGNHPSTALCLEWLARQDLVGRSVIDYGCGSGILALAAARLGARPVLATDIDGQALQATSDNAQQNGLQNSIRVISPGQLAGVETDILVANILANPLKELAPDFAALVRAGGRIALAGLLQEQVNGVQQAFSQSFDMAQTGRRGDWALLAGRRRLNAAPLDR